MGNSNKRNGGTHWPGIHAACQVCRCDLCDKWDTGMRLGGRDLSHQESTEGGLHCGMHQVFHQMLMSLSPFRTEGTFRSTECLLGLCAEECESTQLGWQS